MRKQTLRAWIGLFSAWALGWPLPANAALQGDNWWIGGRIRQSIALQYDLPNDQSPQFGSFNYLGEIKATWQPTDNLVFVGNAWIRGDWLYDLREGGGLRDEGIQDFTSPLFRGQFGYSMVNEQEPTLFRPYGTESKENRTYTDPSDIIRELSVKYADPKGRFALKLGRFQRGWGQSDGLRLLDVLHPQDLRERFVLRDAEDTRIPLTMAALDLNFNELGIGGIFESIGLKRPRLELLYIPEARSSEIVINNPTPGDRTALAAFGFPFPHLEDPVSGFGMPLLGANLSDNKSDTWFKDSQFGARLKFNALGAEWTINGFYGRQDLPTVRLAGANVIVGNAFGDASGGAAVIPLDTNITVGAVHGPGGYLDFLRSLGDGTAAPGTFPLLPFGCADILLAPPDCFVSAQFELDYDASKKVVGLSMIRDMHEFKFGRKQVSPVLRLEASAELNKPFNRAKAVTPFGELERGSPVLALDPSDVIVKKNQYSFLLGADYFLWLPASILDRRSVFTSLQIFTILTEDGDDLLLQAPYAFTRVRDMQNLATFLWSVDIMNDRIFLEGLSIWDIRRGGFVHRQRIDFRYFGDRFIPRIEWMHFTGNREDGVLGLYHDRDLIELQLTYQF